MENGQPNLKSCQATDLIERLHLENVRSLSGDRICSTIGPPERSKTTLYHWRFGLVRFIPAFLDGPSTNHPLLLCCLTSIKIH